MPSQPDVALKLVSDMETEGVRQRAYAYHAVEPEGIAAGILQATLGYNGRGLHSVAWLYFGYLDVMRDAFVVGRYSTGKVARNESIDIMSTHLSRSIHHTHGRRQHT